MDASPASCANTGIFNQKLLFPDSPDRPIDLVVSGPNYGRNTGSSFALGSGTVGAALAASLSQVKAISLSYGHFAILPKKLKEAEARLAPALQNESSSKSLDADKDQQRPRFSPVAAPQVVSAAHKLSASLIKRLWDQWEPEVGVYTINLPLAWTILEPKVCWTTMWLGKHGRLYDLHDPSKPSPWVPAGTKSDLSEEDGPKHVPDFAPQPHMKLRFAPDMQAMLAPRDLPEGTDICELDSTHLIGPLSDSSFFSRRGADEWMGICHAAAACLRRGAYTARGGGSERKGTRSSVAIMKMSSSHHFEGNFGGLTKASHRRAILPSLTTRPFSLTVWACCA
jgi:tubulin---tyrosine ligase